MHYVKDDHLTLRLPAELARALARWARVRRISKSEVARDAVERYLTGFTAPPEAVPRLTARALAARWPSLPRLAPEEAAELGTDIAAGRAELPAVRPPWE